MAEQVIQGILLALHNIALVGCAAAPFYNRALVLKRAQYGPKLHYELDKVVEDTLQGNAPYCIAFLVTLLVTGVGMPINHYVFQGAFRATSPVAVTALVVKLLAVGGMVWIMTTIFWGINPRIMAIWHGFAPGAAPAEADEKAFFALRARRKALCEVCLKFAIVVLVASAFLGFGRS
ncbi:MAG: hypothetical protein AAB152_00970 [Candidatus Coatesbacteria bacterium]